MYGYGFDDEREVGEKFHVTKNFLIVAFNFIRKESVDHLLISCNAYK
jgi:hypothetical protein